jgi:hypothetical protein
MSKFRQAFPMDIYSFKMTSAHAVKARLIGKGNQSEGVRIAIEEFKMEDRPDLKQGFIERRKNNPK